MKVEPYLYFNGRTKEALDFYVENLGAEVQFLINFSDSPDQTMVKPEMADKVMHATFRIGESQLMASDGQCSGEVPFSGISLSLECASAEEAEEKFAKLSVGGTVQQPLIETFFSPRFGMVADRFGVCWLLVVTTAPPVA